VLKKTFVMLSFVTVLAACGPSQQPPADQGAAPPPAAAPAPAPAPVAAAPAPAGPSANDEELARIKAEQRKLQRQQNELANQQQQAAQAAAAPPPPPACQDCGVIASITPVKQAGQAGLLGGLGGAAVGGLAGNQFGHGKGKTAMTVVGVLGGALAGAEVQKQVTSTTVYQVAVNMETCGQRVVTIPSLNGLSPGTRVHVEGSNLQPY
jgi:outer membrane lipoprotein SlyB